ncbi:hypothetical protein CBL_01628 [Carabus blaptoides fortunei]
MDDADSVTSAPRGRTEASEIYLWTSGDGARRDAPFPVTPLTSSSVDTHDDRTEIKTGTGVTKLVWEEVVSEEETSIKIRCIANKWSAKEICVISSCSSVTQLITRRTQVLDVLNEHPQIQKSSERRLRFLLSPGTITPPPQSYCLSAPSLFILDQWLPIDSRNGPPAESGSAR